MIIGLRHIFLLAWYTLFNISTVLAQTFSCDGQLLIVTNVGAGTVISRPLSFPFVPPFLSAIHRYDNAILDATGFNSKDNFIYGVQENTNAIVRLKSDNSYESLGQASIVDTLKVDAGDCTPEGLYLCYERELNQILVFSVVEEFELINRFDLFWNPDSPNSGPFNTRIFDFAIDPNNPALAYAYQSNFSLEELGPDSTRAFLLSINVNFDDPNLGMVTPVTEVNQSISHLSGVLFSTNSQLFGYGSSAAERHPLQNKLYSINALSGQASVMLTNSLSTRISDACSCPFSFEFTNFAPVAGIYCNNDDEKFKIRISNNSFNPVEGIILRDTFPEGMIIEQVSILPPRDSADVKGIESHVLEISSLNIPPKSTVEIEIKVTAVDAIVEELYNQAYLYNLPDGLDEVLKSDNPLTPGAIGDASLYYVIPRRLEDISYETIAATDCLAADDGMVLVSSPEFIPGQQYDVIMINKVGWDSVFSRVTIDQNNSALIDSLLPGDYQIVQFKSTNVNCGLAVKDTTILLKGPDDQLDLDVSGNVPICENQTLELKALMFPEGKIRWTGPNIFAADILSPTIENVPIENNGEYRIEANYGFCNRVEYLEVLVNPLISASIAGESKYCERDRILLYAEGAGENLQYTWTGPADLISSDTLLDITSASPKSEGYYELISTNGACSDTAGMYIMIMPTPTIYMDSILTTDFCETVTLDAVITNDENVDYTWSPYEGLDCTDCPTPILQPLVQSHYQLQVVNEFLCADSATIEIDLNKDIIVYSPNVFMINATRGNDQFSIFPGCVVSDIHTLNVFDRLGNRIFNSVKNTNGQLLPSWNGDINGETGSSGVYSWSAKVELVDGLIEYLSGDVTLLNEK